MYSFFIIIIKQLKPHFTKPKPFSFDNPDSRRYQQLQLLKKRISERKYQDV